MAACKFRVRGVTVENNVRGIEMRRITLVAMPSEPFSTGEENDPGPDGRIDILVHPDYAKRFEAGDEFDLMFRER